MQVQHASQKVAAVVDAQVEQAARIARARAAVARKLAQGRHMVATNNTTGGRGGGGGGGGDTGDG